MKNLQYRFILGLVAAVFLAPIGLHAKPGSDAALFQQTGDCYQSCVASVRAGANLFVVSRDASGAIFQVDQIRLPREAEVMHSRQPVGETHTIQATGDGGTVEQSSETYITTTEIVVVTTYLYFNADGDLVDVETTETRFGREIEER